MNAPESIQVEIVSTPSVIEELKEEISCYADQVQSISSRRIEDLSVLRFGLETAAALVTIVTGVFYLGELGLKLFKQLEKNKNVQIILRTSSGNEFTFKFKNDLTVSEILQILKRIAEIGEE